MQVFFRDLLHCYQFHIKYNSIIIIHHKMFTEKG